MKTLPWSDDVGTTVAALRAGAAAAVAQGRIWAVQFHPEKSSQVGLHLLANFVTTVHQEADVR